MNDQELGVIYDQNIHAFTLFMDRLKGLFSITPSIKDQIHSIKFRLKEKQHYIEKVRRKEATGQIFTPETVLLEITDYAGIRLLHLYSHQFDSIHSFIMDQIQENELVLHEPPKTYTWDPEYKIHFEKLGLQTEIKESYYTSIHYVVKPKINTFISCEIQVRNLFEEIWGEIEHTINYPIKSGSAICTEQLKVLARLASTGTKLVDSIYLSK